jgi:hypothetical protein
MWLWFATIVNVDESEDEKCPHIIHNLWLSIIDDFIFFVTSNVIHKWLDNMWHLVQLELQLYIMVANKHLLMAKQCMQHVMLAYITLTSPKYPTWFKKPLKNP